MKIMIGVLAMLVLIGCSSAIDEAAPKVVVDSDLKWEKGAWDEKQWQ